MALAIGS